MCTECDGISATSACHSPDVAFDPNYGCPLNPDDGTWVL